MEKIYSRVRRSDKHPLAFFLWTSLVPIILLFFIWNYTTITLLKNNALSKQKALAEQKHSELALLVGKLKSETSGWGTDSRIRELTEKIMRGGCENRSLKTSDTKKTLHPSNFSNCSISLELSDYLIKNKLPLNLDVGIIDILNTDGIVVASSKNSRIDTTKESERSSFVEAKSLPFNEATFFPEILTDPTEFDGRPMLNFTTPIASASGDALVGVLLIHTESTELNNLISVNRDQTTEGYIVNKDRIMATPSRFIPDSVMKQKVESIPVRECVTRNTSYMGEYLDYRGVEVLGASVCDQNLFGVLLVETAKSEIFTEINKIRGIAGALLFLVLILIFSYVFLSDTSIIRSLRHIFPSTFSSTLTLLVVILIIISATIGISFIFTKNIKSFIIDQKISVISSLVAQQADRHINHQFVSALDEWQSENSQRKFADFSEEVLRSFQSVLGVQLQTTSGVLAWSSFRKEDVGKSTEADEVMRAIKSGGATKLSTSEATKTEFGTSSIIEVYLPLTGKNKSIVGVAEAYINIDEISSFTQGIQNVLWIGATIALIFISLLLRYVFRKQDEKIITRGEELSGVIEHSPIGIYTVETDGRIATINPAMLNETGALNTGELIGKNIFELESYRNSPLLDLIREGISGITFDKEIEIASPEGSSKKSYYHYYGVPLKNSDGEVEHLLLMSEDITARKNLENEVREYAKGIEGEYRATLTGLDSSAIVSITDEKGTITYANKKFIEISKYSKEELIGQNHRILKSGEHPDQYYADLWSTISAGKIWRGEIKNKAKDGSFYWVDSTIVPIIGYDGKPKNYVSIRILISDRKEAEERSLNYFREIEESKIKSDALLASLGEGMIATDNSGIIVAINRVAEEMLGWDKSDLVGKKIADTVPAKDENGMDIFLGQSSGHTSITGAGTVKRSEKIFFTKKSGGSVPVAITETPVIINEKDAGAVIIFRDITAENEVEKTRRDLLSLASHQLRTPLSGTKWLIETLKRGIHGPLTRNQEEYLNELYKINERMTTLVHDMLSVLRMEGDVAQAKIEHVSLATLFSVLFESLSAAAKNKRVSLVLEKSEEVEIKTDPLLLRNILENLISNAINYSHTDSEVRVGIMRSGDNIIFKVKDFGIGIPRDEQKQIFERFYRASNAKTYDTHGTGLGLYVSNTLAKKIGGRISFDSEKDMGATFILSIPMQKENSL